VGGRCTEGPLIHLNFLLNLVVNEFWKSVQQSAKLYTGTFFTNSGQRSALRRIA